MKTKFLVITCLFCFTALVLTSCDNGRPVTGGHDDGGNAANLSMCTYTTY